MATIARGNKQNKETRLLLNYVRRARPDNRLYGLSAEAAKSRAHEVMDRVLQSSGLSRLLSTELRWFVEDVAKAEAPGKPEEGDGEENAAPPEPAS